MRIAERLRFGITPEEYRELWIDGEMAGEEGGDGGQAGLPHFFDRGS